MKGIFAFRGLGAKEAAQVSRAVVGHLPHGTEIVVCAGAPEGVAGTLVPDIGLVEI